MFPIYVFRFGSTDLNEPRHGRVFSFYFFLSAKGEAIACGCAGNARNRNLQSGTHLQLERRDGRCGVTF
jgi:hypothetical protein